MEHPKSLNQGAQIAIVKKDSKPVLAEDRKILDPELDAMIGAKLRSYYDHLLSEPVPDRILELLAQLDRKDSTSSPRQE